jgi:hypothetical protein
MGTLEAGGMIDGDSIRKDELEYVLYPWVMQKGLNPVVLTGPKETIFTIPRARNTWTSHLNSCSTTSGTPTNAW